MPPPRPCPPALPRSLPLLPTALLLAASIFQAPAQEPAAPPPATAARRELTTAAQVLALPREEALRRRLPVRLRGIVTLPMSSQRMAYVQDETDAVIVQISAWPAGGLPSGTLVEVRGTADFAVFAPQVIKAEVTVTGSGPMPEPMALPVADMMRGRGFGRWVRIRGVIRDMHLDRDVLGLSVAAQGQRVFCLSTGFPEGRLPVEWLESPVEVDGVCWTDVDANRRPIGFHLVGIGPECVRRQPAADPFAGRPLPLTEEKRLREASDARLLVRGRVVADTQDGRVFLTTDFGPVQVRRAEPLLRADARVLRYERPEQPALEPGDEVECAGAPQGAPGAPVLLDGEFRKLKSGPPPEPVAISVPKAVSGTFDSALVRLRAQVLSQETLEDFSGGSRGVLNVQAGDTLFQAWLPPGEGAPQPPLAPRTLLELTGICLSHPRPGMAGEGGGGAFHLQLTGHTPLKSLGPAPLWMQPGLRRALWAGAAVTAAGLGGVFFLSYLVKRRTRELAAANTCLSQEVEARRRTQTELDRALQTERELVNLKSRFVSLVSHEFRTPLGIIMSAVELLRHYTERINVGQRQELLDDIHESTRRMSGLMEQVLTLGRTESGHADFRRLPLDLDQLAAALTAELCAALSVPCPVLWEPQGDLKGAEGDETLLRHIFSNLLSNAVKYSAEGGTVLFSAVREESDALFTVRDHGLGIPESDLPRVFDAFHRGANVGDIPGTGLGLVIVKRCVELYGGEISVAGAPGGGTVFTVRLPLFAAEG
ncbi:MAG: two-component sensor histidine kinase [Verrucomicrobiales bacterium]|nr:two-component sensor histidine kinase [Verrucomicrobiales bacterium]